MNYKKEILQLLFICFSTSLFAQYQITIKATILDKKTYQPIPFVNIEFLNKDIKTISNKNGVFAINFEEERINKKDLLQFEAFGYKIEKVSASQFYRFLKNTNKSYLVPKDFVRYKTTSTQTSQKYNSNKVTTKSNIYGTVTSESRPLQAVTIKIKNTFTEAQTDVDGNYRIDAKKGDVLLINYLGMKSSEILVTDKNEYNIELKAEVVILREVIVKGEREKDKKLIDLGLGSKKNFDAIGYDVKVLTAKDIDPQYHDLSDLLVGKFANVSVRRDRYGNTLISINREGSINNRGSVLIDLDGQIFSNNSLKPEDNPQFPKIDPQNIESITILKSLAATNKYGSLGRGGVIVIRTKTASGGKAEAKKPSLLATGNDYIEQVQPIDALNIEPDYLQILQNAKTFDEAKQNYKNLKQIKANLSVSFYLDAAEYFLKWDKQYAMVIFTYVEELAKDNAKALKTLAYKYESLNLYEKTRLVYQRIALLRPTEAQSYRDLALIYNTTGYYNEAMRLYKQMLSNSIEDVDFSGLEQPIIDELMHLLAFHRSKVDYRDLPADLLTAKFKQDLRIVFEWNDPNAEFELQFVNPQKKFFKWSHTKFGNRERMIDEIKKGYTTEAYIIDDAEAGEWIINIEALNEKPDINPNYLKYTVYKNYGLPNETKTVKVIQLESITQKVTLDKFMYQQ